MGTEEPGVRVCNAGVKETNGFYRRRFNNANGDPPPKWGFGRDCWFKETHNTPWYESDAGSFICWSYLRGAAHWDLYDKTGERIYASPIAYSSEPGPQSPHPPTTWWRVLLCKKLLRSPAPTLEIVPSP